MKLYNQLKQYIKLVISSLISSMFFVWFVSVSPSVEVNSVLLSSLSLIVVSLMLLISIMSILNEVLFILEIATRKLKLQRLKIEETYSIKAINIFVNYVHKAVTYRTLNVIRCWSHN